MPFTPEQEMNLVEDVGGLKVSVQDIKERLNRIDARLNGARYGRTLPWAAGGGGVGTLGFGVLWLIERLQ